MPKKVVLAIDDITINLMSIRTALSVYSEYIELRLAKNSKIAFDVLRKDRVDLILLDIEMPDMSGFDLLARLKEKKSTQDIPVIFVTSNSDSKTVIKAFNSNVLDYIVKPIDLTSLRKKVIKALDLKLPHD